MKEIQIPYNIIGRLFYGKSLKVQLHEDKLIFINKLGEYTIDDKNIFGIPELTPF